MVPAALPVSVAIDRITGIEAVVLRLEPVPPMEHDARAVELLDEDQTSQGVPLVDELLDGQVVLELEPAPPLRLLLAPVPIEQVGQQPATFRGRGSRRPREDPRSGR